MHHGDIIIMTNIKLAVVGSRNFNDYDLLVSHIDKIASTHNIILIVSGGAIGADKLGEQYAKKNNIPTQIFFPNWKKYGRSAGIIRNKDIIESADFVIAFWDGKSSGTLNSINLAKKLGKELEIVHFDD